MQKLRKSGSAKLRKRPDSVRDARRADVEARRRLSGRLTFTRPPFWGRFGSAFGLRFAIYFNLPPAGALGPVPPWRGGLRGKRTKRPG